MKPTFFIALVYLCLSLLVISCDEIAPAPEYVQAEVVGPDCDQGWYILKVDEAEAARCGVSQQHHGFVTTRNLPEAYQVPDTRVQVALEPEGEYSPKCVAITVMFPAVRVIKVRQSVLGNTEI